MSARLVALSLLLVGTGSVRGADVIVEVAGVGAATGAVRVALYADKAGFDARVAALTRVVAAHPPAISVVFDDVPAGDYAVLVFHDVDGDGELRRGAFGIPTEPWTGSTDGSRFRAPSWEAYAVVVADSELTLELVF